MTEQPMPPAMPNDLTLDFIKFLAQRDAKGRETYGTSLHTFNRRDPLVDALEESIDLCQYLLQHVLEEKALKGAPPENIPLNLIKYVMDFRKDNRAVDSLLDETLMESVKVCLSLLKLKQERDERTKDVMCAILEKD